MRYPCSRSSQPEGRGAIPAVAMRSILTPQRSLVQQKVGGFEHPGSNPGASLKSVFRCNRLFLKPTPIQMPPESGCVCGICPWVASRVETNEAKLEHPRRDFTPVVLSRRSGGAAGPQRGSGGEGRHIAEEQGERTTDIRRGRSCIDKAAALPT